MQICNDQRRRGTRAGPVGATALAAMVAAVADGARRLQEHAIAAAAYTARRHREERLRQVLSPSEFPAAYFVLGNGEEEEGSAAPSGSGPTCQ